ncbi:hypothetical protein QBC37DRAFT_301904, partial [Rhypophila decipiens]
MAQANTELSTPNTVNVKIEVKTSGKNNNNKNKDEREEPPKPCTKCNKRLYRGQVHCTGCDRHIRGKISALVATGEDQQALKAIKDVIVYDSGCGLPSFNDLKWFTELHPLARPRHSMLLADDGILWDQRTNNLYAKSTGKVLVEMLRQNDIPIIPAVPATTKHHKDPLTAVMATINYRTMHRRLMHASKNIVEKACRDAGIKLKGTADDFCEPCVLGKATDELGKEAPPQVDGPLQLIRVDTVQHKHTGHNGYVYSLHIIDV